MCLVTGYVNVYKFTDWPIDNELSVEVELERRCGRSNNKCNQLFKISFQYHSVFNLRPENSFCSDLLRF